MPEIERNALLREVFDIPEVVAASDYVLQLHTGVDHAAQTVAEYVATESLAKSFDEALGYIKAAWTRGSRRGSSCTARSAPASRTSWRCWTSCCAASPRRAGGAGPTGGRRQALRCAGQQALTAEYHLIGSGSLEEALFSGFARRIASLHPEATPRCCTSPTGSSPMPRAGGAANEARVLRRAERRQVLRRVGRYGSAWTPESYDRAAAAPQGDEDRAGWPPTWWPRCSPATPQPGSGSTSPTAWP